MSFHKWIIFLSLFISSYVNAYTAVELDVLLIRDPPQYPKSLLQPMKEITAFWELPQYTMKGLDTECGIDGYPYFVTGNFDGDEEADYAYWAVMYDNSARRIHLYVYESSTKSLKLLEKSTSPVFFLEPLYINKKGAKVGDYKTGKVSTLPHDSIGVMICGKSTREWVRDDNGAYVELWTGD